MQSSLRYKPQQCKPISIFRHPAIFRCGLGKFAAGTSGVSGSLAGCGTPFWTIRLMGMVEDKSRYCRADGVKDFTNVTMQQLIGLLRFG